MSSDPNPKFANRDRIDAAEIIPDPQIPDVNERGYDEEALERFIAVGSIAWSDVPDAAQWVRELRGGEKSDRESGKGP